MRARLTKFWNDVRSSYWFIPSVMCLGAAALAVVLTRIDLAVGSGWVEGADLLLMVRPSGARAVLSTISGSIIGVAGVTFSVTIAAVAYASGQYGPRLLGNFMRDQGNQVTLGTFLATFLYSLLILHTIREPSETGAAGAVGFVPLVSLAAALGLALASVAVLIYFIHHIPESIHIANVVADIGRELRGEIEKRYPNRAGTSLQRDADSPAADGTMPTPLAQVAATVAAEQAGYIQSLDGDGLIETAQEADLVLQLCSGPGAYLSPGTVLVRAWPADRMDEETAQSIRNAFAAGRQRTLYQNPSFLADELVEIAARALSPGVNDPFTATNCLDWLGNALIACARRDPPVALRRDAEGVIRLIAQPVTFETLAERVFGQLRPYVRADRNAALHAFAVMRRVGAATEPASSDRAVLVRHADVLWEGCQRALGQPLDLDEAAAAHRATIRFLHGRSDALEGRVR